METRYLNTLIASVDAGTFSKAAELLRAKVNIPMHYDTFDPIKVNVAEFVTKVMQHGGKTVVVQPGESYELI